MRRTAGGLRGVAVWCFMCVAAAAPFALAQAGGGEAKPVVFRADARVEVDADGKLVKVEAGQDLPEGVRRYIERQLSTWQYRRRLGDKASGNAATWVDLRVCAVPNDAGDYTMGLEFRGNGPRLAGGRQMFVTQGVANAVARHHYNGSIKVHFVINADGSAKLESIDGLDRGRAGKDIETEVRFWISRLAFDTEEVNGQPLATSATLPVEFRTSSSRRERPHEAAMASTPCRMAAMNAGQGEPASNVAYESEIGIVPSS